MKLRKYFILVLLAMLTINLTSSCKDDEVDEQAPRLFRPVASLTTNKNTITVTWDNIKGANVYHLSLYKVEKGADNSEVTTLIKNVECNSSPYVFDDLSWDENYRVVINCEGTNIASKDYSTDAVSVSYPTTLKNVKTIDNAARVTWDSEAGDSIRAIVAVSDVDGSEVVQTISKTVYASGSVDVLGLNPNTSYKFYAYRDTETFTNDTYAGRLNGSTKEPEDFDAKYGAGNWMDIRNMSDSESSTVLQTAEFWETVSDGMTIILRGDCDYKVNNSQPFTKSVRLTTAATLGGNARLVSSGGMTLKKGVDVGWLEFVNLDICSDYVTNAEKEGTDYIRTNTNKNYGGRQVFNINGVACTLGTIRFKGCVIKGYRAVVRAQADDDNINNVIFEDCIIDGIGDQGVVTTNNKKGDFKTISFKNCTVTNIVMLADLRASVSAPTFNIDNCTFCYAPLETTANANTPLLRFGSNNGTININSTLFGPSLFGGGNGSVVNGYVPGKEGSIFLNGTSVLVNVSKSFKTNFTWTVIAEKTYPIEGLNELSMSETDLWTAPQNGEFRLKGNIGEEGVGDKRWQ